MRACCLAAVLFVSTFTAAQATPNLTGDWLVAADVAGTPFYYVFSFKQEGAKLSGTLRGGGESYVIEGTLTGNTFKLVESNEKEKKVTGHWDGTVAADKLSGTTIFDEEHPDRSLHVTYTARRIPPAPAGPPQRHEFVPQKFYRQFSGLYEPVLRIRSGDTVHTTTVDAGGTDEKGVHRVVGGNPETGPFWIFDAMPGDMLKVRLDKLRLNRDYAISDDNLVPRALGPGLQRQLLNKKFEPGDARWKLDLARGLAMPDKPGEHMKDFAIPVKPMLGCVATAAGAGGAPPPTGDSGGFGGNMDFNEIGEGATVYLPVNVPGALLYLGDGHALQGDGELNGNALETSMDVEFTVELVKNKGIGNPRVETADYVMGMGLGGSLDDAFRTATANMTNILMNDYGLTPSEAALVMGSSVEYRISEVADRNAGVVAKIRKDRLAMLKK